MAYPDGFTLVQGGYRVVYSDVSSTATFRARNPVAFSDVGRALIEIDSGTTAIQGIAMNDAADSLPGVLSGKCPVLIPQEDSVFACKTDTNVAAATLEAGEVFDLEKSGNHFRLNEASKASARVMLVPRGYTNQTFDSDDSTVFVQFLGNSVGPVASNASLRLQE